LPNIGWGLQGLDKLLKSCKNLTRRQDDVAALKAYRISFVVLFCNTQTGHHKKGICHLVAIFSAAILSNIIKIGQNLTEQLQR